MEGERDRPCRALREARSPVRSFDVETCPFCLYAAGQLNNRLIVYEDCDVLVVPSLGQKRMNRGHCLVATRAHVPNIYELAAQMAGPFMQAVAMAACASKRAFSADGISVRQNNEAASGQDVFHVHFHIVPRFNADAFESTGYEDLDEQTRIEQATLLRMAWSCGPA